VDTRYLEHWPKTAIKFFGNDITYTQLHRDVDKLAGWLQQTAGVDKGERVILYMQNSPQFVIAYYAILRANAVVIPVNPMNREEEFKHYILDTDARVALCASELIGFAKKASDDLPADKRLKHLLMANYADALPEQYPHPKIHKCRKAR